MAAVDKAPIGVFDSGVGGLSVLRAIRDTLPSEALIYVADSGNAPYGNRPRTFVQERASALTAFLLDRGAKAVVVACNTATGIAVDALRARFSIPIVAVEPAIKPAALRTRSRVVGVLATTGTLASDNVMRLLDKYGAGVRVLVQPCPGLADRVEAGDLGGPAARELVEAYVRPLVREGADVLVLGCTHYSFLRPLIADAAGPEVELIDPVTAVARELGRRLREAGLLSQSDRPGAVEFWTTGPAERVQPVIAELWGERVRVGGVVTSPAADRRG